MQRPKNLLSLFKTGIHTLVLGCRQVSQLQSESLDHTLSLPKRVRMRFHLLVCRWCRRYGKQIRFLHQAAHEHRDELAQAQPQGPLPFS